MTREEDVRFLSLAIALGARGAGRCWPNPSVGCVIVREGRVLARATTAPGGRPHAEPQALAQAGAEARGATAYVSLEPCAHHGRTPPCTEALIAAGIARVVAPLDDADPRVSGAGFAQLRAAGIEVTTGLCVDAAAEAHSAFFTRVTQGRPRMTLKLATTLDGRIATATGESRWITGPEARRHVHAQRARHDAVLVGAGTARADDPSLTVRGLGMTHQPVRIVAARHLDLPTTGTLAQTAREVPVWLLHDPRVDAARRAAWQGLGARLIEVPSRGGHLDLRAALQALGQAGLTSVYCEGGGTLAASLLAAGLVDRLHLYTAGVAIGAEGRPALGPLGLETLGEAPRFTLRDQRALGGDVVSIWGRV